MGRMRYVETKAASTKAGVAPYKSRRFGPKMKRYHNKIRITSGDPSSSTYAIISNFVGQYAIDTTNGTVWVAQGDDSTDWTRILAD